MNKQDLKVLELKITADTEGAKKGFNNLVSSTNNFFDSLKSRLGSIRTLQKDIALENQAIQKEQTAIDNKVKKAETERARVLERLNNIPKYQKYNTIEKVTAGIQEQNKALQKAVETQSKIKEAFLKNPVDFYKNLFSKNIVNKGVEIPFSQFMTNFTNAGITKRIKNAYNKYVGTNPTQFFPRVPIKDIKPDIDNDFLQYTQRKGEVYKGAKNEKIYGTKEEQEAQNKRVANFLAAQGIITPEKHLTEFKNKTTIDSATKEIKELQNLSEKITQYNETEKKLTQTKDSATKARETLAPRITELQSKQTQLPKQVEGLKQDVLDIINSGRLNEETKALIKDNHDITRLQSRLQDIHKDVINPAQSYLYLKGLETPLTRRNLSDLENEMALKNIPEADRQGYRDFFNKVVTGAVDPRDQIRNVIQRTKTTDKIITELAKVKELPAINDLKPTTDLATLATYQGHEKTASNVYNKVTKILTKLGVELPETYDKKAVQNAVDSLVERYQLNDLEKQRIQDATVNLNALYNRKTALSEVIKQSQEKIRDEEKKVLQQQAETERLRKEQENLKQKQTETLKESEKVFKNYKDFLPPTDSLEENQKRLEATKNNMSKIKAHLNTLGIDAEKAFDENNLKETFKTQELAEVTKKLHSVYEDNKKNSEDIVKANQRILDDQQKQKIQDDQKLKLEEKRKRIIADTQKVIDENNRTYNIATNNSIDSLNNIKSEASKRLSELNRASTNFKQDSKGILSFDPSKDFNEQWKNVIATDKDLDDQDVKNVAEKLYRGIQSQNNAINESTTRIQTLTEAEKQRIANEAKANRTNYLNELRKQVESVNKTFDNLTSKNEVVQLLAGQKLAPEIFNNLGIKDLASNVKKLGQVQIDELKKLGIGLEWGATDKMFMQAVERAAAQGKINLSDQTQKNEIIQFGKDYKNLRDRYASLTELEETQNRKVPNPTSTQAQAINNERDLQNDINSRNMQLYAMSHALKAIEVPIQQAVDVSKGNIDEYVKFQSAMVGVAKLLPALRDKDTLLVNKKFEDFRQGVLDLTETLPMNGVELAKASESASRLGVTDPDQIRKVVETGTKLGVAFGMSPDDVTKQVVKIANAKGIDLNKSDSLDKVMEFADAINYLDDHTAASGREIINFTKKAVQTAEGVKMDTKDVSAFGATLVSLGISADSANTGFKNLMTVLQTGPRNQKKGTEYLEKSGYSVKELTTLFKKNPTETAVAFIKRLNKLRNAPAGSDAAAIVRFAFGQMSSQAIMALVNNPEVLEKYLAMARQDSKGWTEKEFQARQKNDPAVRFKLLDNKLKALQIDLGEVLMPIADEFIKTIKDFSDTVQPFIKDHPEFVRVGANAGMGMLGLTKLASFGADTAIIINNLRNFEKLDQIITKLGGYGSVTGALGIAGLTAVGAPLLYAYTEREIDKKNAQKHAIQEAEKGTIKDRKRRATAEHGSVFQERKLQDLKYRLNQQGFDIARGKDGKFSIRAGELKRDKDGKYHFETNSNLGSMYLEGSKLKLGEGTILKEGNAPKLFTDLEEAQRIFYQLEASRAREGIAPRIEAIKNIDKSNVKAYNSLRNKQIEKHNERTELEENIVKIKDSLTKAEKELDTINIGKYQNKLKETQEKLKKVKESQRYLSELLSYTDLSQENSIQNNINKEEKRKIERNKKISEKVRNVGKFIKGTVSNTLNPSQGLENLYNKKKQLEEDREALSFWQDDNRTSQYPKEQKERGKKDYNRVNNNLYDINHKIENKQKNIEDVKNLFKIDNLNPQFGLMDTVYGKNRQQVIDDINRKQTLYNDTIGKTNTNTILLYGANKETNQTLSTMQNTGSTTFDTLNKGVTTTTTCVDGLFAGLEKVRQVIEALNGMTIAPKVNIPNISLPLSQSYNSYQEHTGSILGRVGV